MADDDIVRRAGDHLEHAVDRVLDEERRLPELTRVTVKDCDLDGEISREHVEVPCDICDEYVAVGPGIDGWETHGQPGLSEQPLRERIGSYLLCEPCAASWERADYDDLYERCCLRSRVDDLAQLAGDTIRIEDPARRDEGFWYEL
jgi:hypothetical protein